MKNRFTGIEQVFSEDERLDTRMVQTLKLFFFAEQEIRFGNRRMALDYLSTARSMMEYFKKDNKYICFNKVLSENYKIARRKYFEHFKNERQI